MICLALNLFIVICSLNEGNFSIQMSWRSYNNPVVILYAVFVLCGVLSIKSRCDTRVNAVAKHVFAVYLITEAFSAYLYVPLKDLFNSSFMLGIAGCAAVFILCIAVESVRSSVYNRIAEKATMLAMKRKGA